MNANFQEAIMKSLKENKLEKHKRERVGQEAKERLGETMEN